MPRTITYVGTHAAITTEAGHVRRGGSLTVPDALADELLAQREKGVAQWTEPEPDDAEEA